MLQAGSAMFAVTKWRRPHQVGRSPIGPSPAETAWHAWVAKGRVQDRRRSAAFNKAVKWASLASLLAAGGLWVHLPPFEVVVRCIVAAGAMVVMLEALRARHYATAAVFGTITALFNPIAPVFLLSGDWHHSVVMASAIPFAASLARRGGRLERLD